MLRVYSFYVLVLGVLLILSGCATTDSPVKQADLQPTSDSPVTDKDTTDPEKPPPQSMVHDGAPKPVAQAESQNLAQRPDEPLSASQKDATAKLERANQYILELNKKLVGRDRRIRELDDQVMLLKRQAALDQEQREALALEIENLTEVRRRTMIRIEQLNEIISAAGIEVDRDDLRIPPPE